MDQPPSTTSSSRTARRALKTGLAALSAIAAPVVLVVSAAGGSGTAGLEHQLLARQQVHTQDASTAVRFVDGSAAVGTSLASNLANGEITGIRGLVTDPVAVIPTPTTTPPAVVAPAPAAAPTTTTTTPRATLAKATVTPPPPAPAGASGLAYGDPADPATWDRLAQCEAGGNWARNSGNGYYGGLQFSAGTWRSVGGTGLPHQNSRETQIEMGRRLQARSGWGQWPACTRRLHYR